MGANESQPAVEDVTVEDVTVSSKPLDADDVLRTMEKVVASEYANIQDDLVATAEIHTKEVKGMVS